HTRPSATCRQPSSQRNPRWKNRPHEARNETQDSPSNRRRLGSQVKKKVSHWRAGFLTLSDLLCWPIVCEPAPPPPPGEPVTEFLRPDTFFPITYPAMAFHPELVAERINLVRGESPATADPDFAVRPSKGVPDHIRHAIAGEMT